MSVAEQLSSYVRSVEFENLPSDVVMEAKKRLVDGIGCAIGAFDAEPVSITRKIAEGVSSSTPSTLLGTAVKTTPDLAAFVNGIMVRYFDFNDTYLGKEPAHPSDNVSACLSVAESERASGKEFLLSLALAYEIQCRLCDLADIRHRGWDHVNYGLVSTALAAGRLLGLDVNRLTQAVNIALNPHIAMRQVRAGELSMWKGASFAEAARNAVFSAYLAKGGMTGPSPIFEGEMGFFKQVSGRFSVDPSVFGGKGGGFKIARTFIKYFPAEYHSQSAIWAALGARRKVGNLDDIASVLVETHEAGFTILGNDQAKWSPANKETADHSLPYIVSMALKEGKIDNETYSDANIHDRETLQFMKRVEVKEDRGLTSIYPETAANRVSLRLRSGSAVSEEVLYPKGHPRNPMTVHEVEDKFRRLTSRYLSESHTKEILGILWNIEKVNDVSEVLKVLQLG
jgi:2-methylcitrate dehydratase